MAYSYLKKTGTACSFSWKIKNLPAGARVLAQVETCATPLDPHHQPDDEPRVRNLPVTGTTATITLTAKYTGTYLITVSAWNSAGMLYSQPSGVRVRFLSPATIVSFSATPSAVRTGKEISLSWQVTGIDGHVLHVVRTTAGGNVTKLAAEVDSTGAGSLKDTCDEADTLTYQLVVQHPEAPSDAEISPTSGAVSVTVTAVPPVTEWPTILPVRTGLRVANPLSSTNPGVDRKADLQAVLANADPPVDAGEIATAFGYACTKMAKVTGYSSPAPVVPTFAIEMRDEINQARRRIPVRPIRPDPANAFHGNAYWRELGSNGDATTAAQASRDRHISLPSNVAALPAMTPWPPFSAPAADDAQNLRGKWQVYQHVMAAEGHTRCITAFGVDQFLTVGPGYCTTGGGPQRWLDMMFREDAFLGPSALAAGLLIEPDPAKPGAMRFVVADTTTDPDHPCRLEGADANVYISCSFELLSFIANIMIGAQPDLTDGQATLNAGGQEQMMFDTQWRIASTGHGPVATLPETGGDILTESLACHAVHNNSGQVADFKGLGTIAEVASKIWEVERAKHGYPTTSQGRAGPRATYGVSVAVCRHWGAPAMSVLASCCQRDCKVQASGAPCVVPPPPGWPWKDSSEPLP